MELLFVTMDDTNLFMKALVELQKNDIKGIALPSHSLRYAIEHEHEHVPVFGFLTKMFHPEYEKVNTMVALVNEENYQLAVDTINEVTKGMKGEGHMFTMPISKYVALGDK